MPVAVEIPPDQLFSTIGIESELVTRNSRRNNRRQAEQTLINLVQIGTFGTLVPFVPRVPLQKTAYF